MAPGGPGPYAAHSGTASAPARASFHRL